MLALPPWDWLCACCNLHFASLQQAQGHHTAVVTVSLKEQANLWERMLLKPCCNQDTLPFAVLLPPLFVLCKHLFACVFVSTIAFLTVNFHESSQDKGICEQTAVLIVTLLSAECSSSSICLCDTLGISRAVGCPPAACPRLGNATAEMSFLRPVGGPAAALVADPQAAHSLGSPWIPWQAHIHGFRLTAAGTSGCCIPVGTVRDRHMPASMCPLLSTFHVPLSSGHTCPPPYFPPVLIYRLTALGHFIWSPRYLWALAVWSVCLWSFWVPRLAPEETRHPWWCQAISSLNPLSVPVPSHLFISSLWSPGGAPHSVTGDFMSY